MAKCGYCEADTELYDGGIPICVGCSDRLESKRKPSLPAQDINSVLHHEVVAAAERVKSASEAFYSTMADIPSRLPHPDGTQRIRSASNRLTVARKDMTKAYSRLNDYLTHGIVPEDLKRSG